VLFFAARTRAAFPHLYFTDNVLIDAMVVPLTRLGVAGRRRAYSAPPCTPEYISAGLCRGAERHSLRPTILRSS